MQAHILSKDPDGPGTQYSVIELDDQGDLIKAIWDIYGGPLSRRLLEIKFNHNPEVKQPEPLIIVPSNHKP